MVNKFLILVLFYLLFMQIACNNEANNDGEESKMHEDCIGDTIQNFTYFTASNLDSVDEIILEQYVKGSAFKKFIKSEKRRLFKGYAKREQRWHFSSFEPLNINYDYLFIVPMKNDSDFYYVKEMKLRFGGNQGPIHSCILEYWVNYYKQEERFSLIHPLKKR